MTRVIGVRFRTAGKIYFFDPGELEIKRGSHVIVETARGIEYGTVVAPAYDVEDDKVVKPIKTVIRIANETDENQEKTNREKEKEAFKVCQEKIRKHGLDMKLIDAEYTFDNNKILFYFTADGRIDFRALVKDLAAVFRTRIELRQIGVRDETKIIGGYGICGRPLCCHSYLSDFAPVSIKMAKEQNLSLNPTKISGVCGRLMCCLKNEEEVYEELNKKLPKVGDIVRTDDGFEGEVANVGVLRQTVRILVDVNDEKEVHDYTADQVHFVRKKSKHGNEPKNDKTEEVSLEELKALEDMGTSGDLDSEDGQEQGGQRNQGRNNRNQGPRNNRPGKGDNNRNNNRNNDNRSVNRNGDNRNSENRNSDNRGGDNRNSDNRNADNRGDNRNNDSRNADNRNTDNRGDNNRYNDNRNADGRNGGRDNNGQNGNNRGNGQGDNGGHNNGGRNNNRHNNRHGNRRPNQNGNGQQNDNQ
ncbi:Cell fate regulator YaaT, PSP1 superfamily (controls sporulation, competence, biofilm development) [Butyrivibrio fibrisolvens DSM 3071]|uniref:Cell fate regulator YaaT, PSP1 superfamily (Controls sporulation, competence, biofilm development) n=1 Tax=Butyrivibrio fibrisolvens DSM 3071 TaxID=1121131 RepID=A0A1M6AE41_BUTFI|nr:stage 0 sporulation family protein [Butyrivibrio fibrisolvens]SHI34729.1 Cell fate regulator YaaT, PSP1 superfamily (controls sporulation, competence, biofilm development) [Butyrivibrio fibrisolvens DSM 3071]